MKNQIPLSPRFLLIGDGRTARHFQNYFQLLQIPFQTWSRRQGFEQLEAKVSSASHVLLLISDSALESFYREHLQGQNKIVVHFSGAQEIEGLYSAHPLMTFSEKMYDLATYRQMPFVMTTDLPLEKILPGLTNPHFRIPADKKAYYHALCVMSGNFTNLLWRKMDQEMKALGLQSAVFHPYLQRITQNILEDSQNSLTGPIARRDLTTIRKNDRALSQDSYQKIYRAFLDVYYPEALKELTHENS